MCNFCSVTKFHAQIWQFRKMAHISQTAARRVKTAQFQSPGILVFMREEIEIKMFQVVTHYLHAYHNPQAPGPSTVTCHSVCCTKTEVTKWPWDKTTGYLHVSSVRQFGLHGDCRYTKQPSIDLQIGDWELFTFYVGVHTGNCVLMLFNYCMSICKWPV